MQERRWHAKFELLKARSWRLPQKTGHVEFAVELVS
jgi:hypothetical protein